MGSNNYGTISNSYATGAVTSSASASDSNSYGGGLVGRNNAWRTISKTHYFVDNSGTNGLGSGVCYGTCTQKTLAQLQALTSVTDWSTDNWNFGTTTQLPVSSTHRPPHTVLTTPTRLNKPVKMLQSRGSSKDVMATRGSPVGMSFMGNEPLGNKYKKISVLQVVTALLYNSSQIALLLI